MWSIRPKPEMPLSRTLQDNVGSVRNKQPCSIDAGAAWAGSLTVSSADRLFPEGLFCYPGRMLGCASRVVAAVLLAVQFAASVNAASGQYPLQPGSRYDRALRPSASASCTCGLQLHRRFTDTSGDSHLAVAPSAASRRPADVSANQAAPHAQPMPHGRAFFRVRLLI
jgi:hypothetical protein